MRMVSGKVTFIVMLMLMLSAAKLSAQKTQVYNNPIKHYNTGLELYDKEKYAGAIPEFEKFMEVSKDFETKINAQFYLAMCGLELTHKDAEQQLLNLLDEFNDHPKTNLARFALGKYYYRQNQFSKAIDYLEKTDELDLSETDRNEYYFDLGYSYFSRDKYPEATPHFEKIKNNKDKYYFPTNYYLGYMSLKQDKLDAALVYFENIRKSKVYASVAPLYMTQIYYRRGAYDQVIAFTDTAGNISKPMLWLRGKAFFHLGNYPAAAGVFDQYTLPKDEITNGERYIVGRSYYEAKSYEKAYLQLTSISDNKDTVKQYALFYAADCFLKLDKKSNARNAFYEASRLDFNKEIKEKSHFNYAKLSFELSFQQDAISSFTKFTEEYPDSELADEAKSQLSEVFLNTKKYRDAIPVLESIRNKNQKTKEVFQSISYFYANELLLDNQLDEAEKYFNKAKQFPEDPRVDALVDFWLGEINFNRENYRAAVTSWTAFLNSSEAKNTPVYKDAFYNLGYAYFKLKDYGKASAQFKSYTDKESYGGENAVKYIDGMTRQADCYFINKNYNDALTAYSYVTSKDAPNSDYAQFQKGIIYGFQGRYDEKIQALKKIPQKYPGSVHVDPSLFEIASVHLQLKQYREALREFSYLLDDNPNNVFALRCYMNRGLIYYNLKQPENAITEFKTVVRKFPTSPEKNEAIEAVTSIYTEMGEGDELLAFLKEANVTLSVSYEDSLIYNSTYNRYLKDKNCTSATKEFGAYITRFPKGSFLEEANFIKAECDFKLKKFDEALKGYLFVISRNNGQFMERASGNAADIYFNQKKYDLALPLFAELERVSLKKENQLFAQMGQMNCNYLLGNFEPARLCAERILKNDVAQKAHITDANLVIGRVYLEQEKWDIARIYFDKIWKEKENKNNAGAEALYSIALIEYHLKNYAKAQATIYDVDDKFTNQVYWVAKGYVLLGQVYLAQDDKFQARATLQSIVDNYDSDTDGIKEEARKLLQEAQ